MAVSEGARAQEALDILDKGLLTMYEFNNQVEGVSLATLSDQFASPLLSGRPAYNRDDYMLTRIEDLNRRIVGFFRGDLIVICAPPSGGKTSFALDVAVYNSAVANNQVIYFTIDETQRSMVQRVYCASTGLPQWRFSDGRLTNDELEDVEKTRESLRDIGRSIYFVDKARNLSDIRAYARRHSRKQGLDLIIIDYLQQVAAPRGRRYENRNLEMTETVQQLKELAKELSVPVVVVSQFSRKYEADTQKILKGIFPRPQISWMRDSGSIEQEANLIIGMLIPGFILKAVLGPAHKKTMAELARNPSGILNSELIIMKNKMGETGSVPCKFSVRRMQFFSELYRPTPSNSNGPTEVS
jgi:replicative DNA helicase